MSQDIHGFAMRDAPAVPPTAHHLDLPLREEAHYTSMSIRNPDRYVAQRLWRVQGQCYSGFAWSADTHISLTHGQSMRKYQSHQYQTPAVDIDPASCSWPSPERSWSYTPRSRVQFPPDPREPISHWLCTPTAVSPHGCYFGIPGMSGGTNLSTIRASYQELFEHIWFHEP